MNPIFKSITTYSGSDDTGVARPTTELAGGLDDRTIEEELLAPTHFHMMQMRLGKTVRVTIEVFPEIPTLTPVVADDAMVISGMRVAESKVQLRNWVFTAELVRFRPEFRDEMLGLLWGYILDNQRITDVEINVAVSSAIRKFIGMVPKHRDARSPWHFRTLSSFAIRWDALSIEHQIEFAKMVRRVYENDPSVDVILDLSNQLNRISAQCDFATASPKHRTAIVLALVALIVERGSFAHDAFARSRKLPKWAVDVIDRDLKEVHITWCDKDKDAATWLQNLQSVASP